MMIVFTYVLTHNKKISKQCLLAKIATYVSLWWPIHHLVCLRNHLPNLRQFPLALSMLVFLGRCRKRLAVRLPLIEWKIIWLLVCSLHHAHSHLFQLFLQIDSVFCLLLQLLQQRLHLLVSLLLEILILFLVLSNFFFHPNSLSSCLFTLSIHLFYFLD